MQIHVCYLLTTVNFEPCEVDIQHSLWQNSELLFILQKEFLFMRSGKVDFSRPAVVEEKNASTEQAYSNIKCITCLLHFVILLV